MTGWKLGEGGNATAEKQVVAENVSSCHRTGNGAHRNSRCTLCSPCAPQTHPHPWAHSAPHHVRLRAAPRILVIWLSRVCSVGCSGRKWREEAWGMTVALSHISDGDGTPGHCSFCQDPFLTDPFSEAPRKAFPLPAPGLLGVGSAFLVFLGPASSIPAFDFLHSTPL